MSGFLAQHGSVDAVLFEYADGFRGGVRAYEAASKKPDVIVTLRTDEMEVIVIGKKPMTPTSRSTTRTGRTIRPALRSPLR